jgi:hypothetical protein
VVKTAFLVMLFNDAFYVMDSEPALERRYADLMLRVRPDMRQYALLDHLLEFKTVSLKETGLQSAELVTPPRETDRFSPPTGLGLSAPLGGSVGHFVLCLRKLALE